MRESIDEAKRLAVESERLVKQHSVRPGGIVSSSVAAIDAAGGKITLDHSPIPELGWPAMYMTIKAAPAVTGSTAVGDEVEFEVRGSGVNSEVTAITKK